MAYEHKSAWIMLVLAVATYAVYVVVILGRVGDVPLAEVAYVAPMLWAIGVSIVGSILLHIAVGVVSHKDAGRKDVRDKEIDRASERIGQSFVVIGALGALVMAMLEWDHFWIANAIYLCFTLSAILGSIAKIFAYQRGFQSW